MRKTLIIALIAALILAITISTHKPREPDIEPVNRYFDNADRYWTMEEYR